MCGAASVSAPFRAVFQPSCQINLVGLLVWCRMPIWSSPVRAIFVTASGTQLNDAEGKTEARMT